MVPIRISCNLSTCLIHLTKERRVSMRRPSADDLVLDIDRKAAEHGVGPGRQRSYRVEYEFMRNRLALLDGEEGVVRREGGRIATWLRHGIWGSEPKIIFGPSAILPSALSGLRQSFCGQPGTLGVSCGN